MCGQFAGGGVQQCNLLMKHWSIVWEVSRNKDYLGIGHVRVVHEVCVVEMEKTAT